MFYEIISGIFPEFFQKSTAIFSEINFRKNSEGNFWKFPNSHSYLEWIISWSVNMLATQPNLKIFWICLNWIELSILIIIIIFNVENIGFFHAKLGSDVCPRVNNQTSGDTLQNLTRPLTWKSQIYPENPEETWVIVSSKNKGYDIYRTLEFTPVPSQVQIESFGRP